MGCYITYEDYTSIYGTEHAPEGRFNLYRIEASRLIDYMTTGVDGVSKLKEFYPTNEDDVLIVKTCICKLVDFLWQVASIEDSAANARGFMVDANGIHGKTIASRSAGNESISYASGDSSNATAFDKAVSDVEARKAQMTDIVRTYLNGITDRNGVRLLYLGVYPRIGGDADV